jgi:hypothetical protein
VRDLVLREALRDLAEEAAERFRELLRSGQEIAYEIREPGDGSPFCHYTPLTGRFIRDQAAMVAGLDAFGPAKSSLIGAEAAPHYLAQLGVEPVPDPGRQAEDALLLFLCRLWSGSSDFSLEPGRLEAAISELESSADPEADEVEVVIPVVGLRMPCSRLDLATATLVRADVVDAPREARSVEGTGRAGFEPQFLAYARCSVEDLLPAGESDPAAAPRDPVAARFHGLVTALRLFKPGGIGLGPHGWTRTGGGSWRRISTGAGRPRPGGYLLADSELADLAGFSRALERRPVRVNALGRAISRFEAGLERRLPVEALNDYLLCIRFLLEGGGPAATGLPMRVAALCAEPSDRAMVKRTLDQALALERELWSGDPPPPEDGRSPLEITSAVEDLTRAILRDAACGHLGGDLRATADEILLADGLAAGEGDPSQRGETTEWEPGETRGEEGEPEDTAAGSEPPAPQAEPEQQPLEPEIRRFDVAREAWTPFVPTAERPEEPSDGEKKMEESGPEPQNRQRMVERNQPQADDWLAEAGNPGDTLEFPERPPALRLLDQRPEERKAIRQRVSTLFPLPEATDWSVGELEYDRSRRADVRA